MLLMGLASVAAAFGANVYQVQSGNWNSDIWSSSSGGSVTAGLRPNTSNPAYLASGLSVTVSGGTYSVSTVSAASSLHDVLFAVDSGSTLSVIVRTNLMATNSNYLIAGTFTTATQSSFGGVNSNITISGLLYTSVGTLFLGSTGSFTTITGTVNAAAQSILAGAATVSTGGRLNAAYSLNVANGVGDSLTVDGGSVYVNRFYGARLSATNFLVSYNVLSGTFTHTGSEAELIGKDAANSGVSVFNQSGGTVSMSGGGGYFYLTGTAGSTQSVGVYNLSGGTLVLNGAIYYGSAGAYRSTGVSRTGSASAYDGYVGGKLDFTGGNLVAEAIGISLTNSGGHLVVGLTSASAKTLTAGTASGMTYTQQASGAMDLDIFSATAFDKVNYAGNTIVLENGTKFYVTLQDDYNPVDGTVFSSVLLADSISGDATTVQIYVNGELSAWQAEKSADGTALNLIVASIPEPAAAALLTGALALALAVRRRRR